MDPSEVEFLAEKEEVTIVPNFSHDEVFLIGGNVGPFNPSLPMKVPLWMAINLKQRQKCRIQPPDWMLVEKLEEVKKQEHDSAVFQPMVNPHYMEVTKLLLSHATDDIPNADEVNTLIKDIWDLRMAKLRQSIDKFVKDQETHARLDNLSLMEINSVRPFLTQALDHMHTLRMNLLTAGPGPTQDS
ncbi:DNA replication complex GINS protein PSF2 [Strongylocentrotus purpuratus]|uniref:DNA replication complex GINS protein PSF2 n=1 Tax=Strongylocentrotus purpuratus TaxID=7668 RepID=A0A7M7HGT9_STRPU|nr:DNA replication complex GINS protein PSF2 [Strongylocentrotus purpuratus]XP_030831327.1 DNA replication complex GINS protein PSF2 [Strongylocentrotus purpuratus]